MKGPPIRRLALALIAGLTLTASVFAQGMPPAPKEMAKFDRLTGIWEGSGMAVMDEEGTEIPWKASLVYQKILGGRFFQEDTRVDIQAPGVPSMNFRVVYGYDTEKKQYVSFGCGNDGTAHARELWWQDDDTLLVPVMGIEEGAPVFGREILKISDDTVALEMYGANGAKAFCKRVHGTFKRARPMAAGDKPDTGKERAASVTDHSVSLVPPSPEMAKLEFFKGDWRITGQAVPMPGAPAMDIGANETFTFLHGGHTLVSHVVGDPIEGFGVYEAYGYVTWNPHSSCYETFHVTSMGEIGTSEARWIDDDTFVAVSSALKMGTPVSMRNVMKKRKDGKITSTAEHMWGAEPASPAFTGTYVRPAK